MRFPPTTAAWRGEVMGTPFYVPSIEVIMPRDRYQQLTALPPGRFVAKRLGLPESRPLRRYEPAGPALAGPALVGGDGRLGDVTTTTLAALGAEIRLLEPDDGVKLGALVFDATGIANAEGLRALY